MPAVMPMAPASPCGSAQAPARTVRAAETSGRSEDLATMTRRPLARVFSAGLGSIGSTGAASGGGAWRWPSGARVTMGPEYLAEATTGGFSTASFSPAGRALSGW